ncbi:PilZ domain-containing protein [Hyphomicrobium sp.]|uniref:PilZ domain-containing protein n=1 Tax=Hyphomicrobium sp. TaxID=82 RepID=UPI00356A120D
MRTRSAVSFEPAHGHALFEALVCEFHWTVLQVAAITSCMNASVAENRAWKLRACSNLFPVESPVITAALRTWDEIGLPRDLSASLNKIYRDLSDAKRLALPIARDAGTFSGPNISLLKLQQIAAVWRKLTEDCEVALQSLEPEARWRLCGLYTGNSLVLGKFLKAAISGAYSCVNQIGEVAIPVLPQRRKTRRYVLVQPCTIRGRNVNAAVIARHISSNGIGLESDQDFELKERVIVELRNGRKIRGTIVWMRNKQLDVQFEETLAASDPLFAR